MTFSGTPVLSSEESNLDLVVGSDHALHVTADAEDDALTAYVQEHLQYTSSDPAVVSVDQYGRLHVNAEGDAVIKMWIRDSIRPEHIAEAVQYRSFQLGGENAR